MIAYASRQLKPFGRYCFGIENLATSFIRKANVIVDALNRKSMFASRAINILLTLFDDGSILVELKAKPLFFQQICGA
ncbi:RNA-directed DNA polymerase-like protein [Gossypium australe]|uniref:RNA-directed DNA polymerase-like protein n=1 Tax=Gossypium australe TaxID=47621 RepID=A0A5B6UX76_9ROSI|nr:RNA-directed DNA polymerase-like protein [Gossypium australe]